jgi:SAM-dependent methyltransferase
MGDDTETDQHPRDIGTSVQTFAFPTDGYGEKYQDWFFHRYQNEIAGRILDIGSEGDQMHRYGISKSDTSEYLCLDIRPSDSLDVIGDGRALPFRDKCFDTIILREVIEHIPVSEISTLLKEIYRILGDEGRLLLTTPFRFQIHGYGYTDKLRLTTDGLNELLQRAGFEDITLYKGGGFVESVCSPLQTVWFMLSESLEMSELRSAYAVLHYPAFLCGLILNKFERSVLDEAILDKIFYIHNMAIAKKSPGDR